MMQIHKDRLARKALAGEIEGADSLKYVRDYIEEILVSEGGVWTQSDGLFRLFSFLSVLRDTCDPDGDSHFRLELRRVRPGNLKKRREARHVSERILAALRVDRLLADGVDRKRAMGLVQDETGVSSSEIYKARKDAMYLALKK